MSAGVRRDRRQELSFTVQSIDCIACSPMFRRPLARVRGVLEVKELPITNKIIVVFNEAALEKERLREEVEKIASKAGLGNKIIFG